MTLEQLGSVGEFVGAFAVLLTLVYLAYQTRQNGELLRQARDTQKASMATANVQNWHTLFSQIAEDAGTAELVGKLRRKEKIDEHDIDRMSALLFMNFLTVENLMIQGQLNSWGENISEDTIDRFCRYHINWLLSSPSSIGWWQQNKIAFSDQFSLHMDRLMEAQYPTAT